VYRVGDDWLDDPATIVRYQRIVRRVLPTAWVRPYGNRLGEAEDHLHLDLGYVLAAPHGSPGDDEGPEADAPKERPKGARGAEAGGGGEDAGTGEDGSDGDGHHDGGGTARERKE
jgi:hypothetical protein